MLRMEWQGWLMLGNVIIDTRTNVGFIIMGGEVISMLEHTPPFQYGSRGNTFVPLSDQEHQPNIVIQARNSILLGHANDHLPEYFEPAALVDAYVPNDTHGTLRRIVVQQEIATPAQTYNGTEVVDAVVSERTANPYYRRYANQPPPTASYMFDPLTYAPPTYISSLDSAILEMAAARQSETPTTIGEL